MHDHPVFGYRFIADELPDRGVSASENRVARRTAEGKNKREIIRCLKRYVIREVYHLIIKANPATSEIGSWQL